MYVITSLVILFVYDRIINGGIYESKKLYRIIGE